MITVRFPSGFSVQYNSLDHVDIRANGIYLGKKSAPNTYSVWCPTDCIVEHTSPCRTYQAATEQQNRDLVAQLEALRKEVRALGRKVGKSAGASGATK